MANKEQLFYIAFYRYEDSKIWQRSNLSLKKEPLENDLKGKDYVEQSSIQIKEIYLPE